MRLILNGFDASIFSPKPKPRTMEMDSLDSVVDGFKIYLALLQLHKISSPIPVRISHWSEVTPDAVAVKDKTTSLSYQQLDTRSNILANYLLSTGTSKEECIGVHLKESVLIPVTVLGIMKAGATYVPLSIDLPVNRINRIVEDAAISKIFTDVEKAPFFDNTNVTVFELDAALSQIQHPYAGPPAVEVHHENAAYIIYTSGSTGDPKGVIVSNGSMTNYLDWYLEDLQEQTGACLPLTSSISFAAGVTQLFSALLQGETLHIIERSMVRQPALLLEWYRENPSHALYCVPTLWEEVMTYVELCDADIAPPACLFLSGESLPKSLADRTFQRWPALPIWNLYGPTEATANVSYYKVERGSEIYLGKPIRGARMFLLNEELKPVREGDEGFIYVISQSLAREYKNKPELSRRSFITDHNLQGYENHTLYNTGDIGKFTANNELMFLGRKDQQVKIRGHRIELSEVEKYLQAVPGIRQVACKVATDRSGQAQIHAFLVCGQQLTVSNIRDHLLQNLPMHMVPGIFHFLEAMPKLPNGKINRNLLLTEVSRANLRAEFVGPQTTEEKMLLGIWEEVLEIRSPGMRDDFFELGGNSLKMIRLINLVKSRMQKEVSIPIIWEHTTPELLLTCINASNQTIVNDGLIISQPADKKTGSLSLNQVGQWFTLQSRPGLTAYNMLFTLALPGDVSVDSVQRVLDVVLKKHDILRSNFKISNHVPMRVIHDATAKVEFSDLSEMSAEECTAFEQQLTEHLLRLQPDLAEDALTRFHLTKQGAEKFKLFVSVHHIIFDGFSISIFAEEFANAWRKYVSGDNSQDQVETLYSYEDYVQWERRNYYDEKMSSSVAFWKQQLTGGNFFLNFPTDNPRPKVQGVTGKNKALVIDAEVLQAIESFNRQEKTTSFIVLLSVFKLLLQKYSRETDIAVGVPFANRMLSGSGSIIGLFANTVVYRTQCSPALSFRELMHAIRNFTAEAMEHQAYPFPKLLQQVNPERSVSYHPLFQVMFSYNDKLKVHDAGNGDHIKVEELQNPACKFDLELEAQENEDNIVLNFHYDTGLFEDATIDSLMAHFHHVLLQILQKPEAAIGSFPLEDQQQLQQKLSEWNNTGCAMQECCLHERFEQQVQKNTGAIAVRIGNNSITYNELNARSNRIAHAIRQQEIMPNELVGIMAHRSLEMMAGILGILKSGAAYLPLDPQWPLERLNNISSSSGLRIVLAQHEYIAQVQSPVPVLDIDNHAFYNNYSTENPVSQSSPSDLAYVIYTSGSTGIPKGVMIEHRSVINRINWMQKTYPLNENDVILQKTPITFDVSVWELFWWFFEGGSVCLLEPGGEKNPETIINAIKLHNISTLHFVPSLFSAFLEYVRDNKPTANTFNSVKHIFTSGEALEKYHVEKFNQHVVGAEHIQLINLYGPTEATVDVSYFNCAETNHYARVPIGKPIDNIQIYILDEQGQSLPEKIPGELCIGGIGLARGYLNNPALTAEKFFQSNFNNTRLYRTGDLARWLPDGNIEYLGRTDQQIKIRGLRMEPGEIENAINQHAAVETSVAVVKKLGNDDARLFAYYVPRKSGQPIDLKTHLRRLLPDYMIPAAFVPMQALPLLSNGKLDLKSLPHPFEGQQKVIGQRSYNNEYEQRLAAIWSRALKHDDFDVEDNFYDVGGHSLLLISIKMAVDAEFSIKISLVDLFKYPTIRSVAERIASASTLNHKTQIGERARLQKNAIVRLKRSPS